MSGYSYESSSLCEIFLNVYDLHDNNGILSTVGLGVFHTGVEIRWGRNNAKEFSFSNSGISRTSPKLPEFGTFREQLKIGEYEFGIAGVNTVIDSLSESEFGIGTYNLMSKNCNNFSNSLCQALCNQSIPSYINRAATLGSSLLVRSDDENTVAEVEKPSSKSSNFSIFSWICGSRESSSKNCIGSTERAVVQGNVIVAANLKKELTEKQKSLLLKLKRKNGEP